MTKSYEGFIAVGKIVGVFGYQGWVKVSTYSGVKNRFARVKRVYIDSGTELEHKILTGQKYHQQQLLLKFGGMDDRETSREFKGRELFLPDAEKIVLPENNFFIHDLRGLKVYHTSGEFLGILTEIMSTGGNDLLVVKTEQKEILIPAVGEFIQVIDLEKEKVIVRLWEDM